MTPWLDDGDVRLYLGDALDVLRDMPDGSVDCVVTSPPYWGLRDYGTGQWDGGEPNCDHVSGLARSDNGRDIIRHTGRGGASGSKERLLQFRDRCGKCGARRTDQQLGLEPTPDQFVQAMVAVFREVRRVLAPHGTCWVNLGDSYAASQTSHRRGTWETPEEFSALRPQSSQWGKQPEWKGPSTAVDGLKPKDLIGIPWRVAFALQNDGWYLRSDIVWAKPNPMPESVTDRPTKSHEYVFLLTKQPRYWFDQEAVREPNQWKDGTGWSRDRDNSKRFGKTYAYTEQRGAGSHSNHQQAHREAVTGRNIRSVWQIATQPYPEAHFATFPEELARRCVLAGCPTRVCRVCGRPSERIADVYDSNGQKVGRRRPEPMGAWLRAKREGLGIKQSEVAALFPSRTGGLTGCVSNWELDKNVPTSEQWAQLKPLLELGDEKDELLAQWHQWERGEWGTTPDAMTHGAPSAGPARTTTVETTGWTDCGCNDESGEPLPTTTNTYEGGWRPGVVLDPFIGSGTVAKVARDHGRHSIGIDLNEQYLELAARRLQQLSLLT